MCFWILLSTRIEPFDKVMSCAKGGSGSLEGPGQWLAPISTIVQPALGGRIAFDGGDFACSNAKLLIEIERAFPDR
jgi:hypothetical protein